MHDAHLKFKNIYFEKIENLFFNERILFENELIFFDEANTNRIRINFIWSNEWKFGRNELVIRESN